MQASGSHPWVLGRLGAAPSRNSLLAADAHLAWHREIFPSYAGFVGIEDAWNIRKGFGLVDYGRMVDGSLTKWTALHNSRAQG